MKKPLPVLIVGAGPTGLVLALWLTKIGIKVRLIDKALKAGTTSRALVIHARTLEFYRQLGISEEVIEKSFRFPAINLWVKHTKKTRFSFKDIGKSQSPFPYVMILPQDVHEEYLVEKLKSLNVFIERDTELIEFTQHTDKVSARIRLPSGKVEEAEAEYLAGCDGAHSTVRQNLKVGFQGNTYPHLFYVADIEGDGPALNGELHISLDKAEFIAIFPLKKKGAARLIGVIPENKDREPTWQDASPRLLKEMEINVQKLNWFSTYRVHHRVASHFTQGRIFLLGDAGHIHSPVGGQGMNTGIGDAVNLAWKLGDVLLGKDKSDLLDTYETERIRFARQLVSTTDRAFYFITSNGSVAQFVRTKVVPSILKRIFQSEKIGKLLFRVISQTGITYGSRLTLPTSHLLPGDRLPWVESLDNFAPLKSLNWQVHIYGDKKFETNFELHRFPWNEEAKQKKLLKNTPYLIRPDGHISQINFRS